MGVMAQQNIFATFRDGFQNMVDEYQTWPPEQQIISLLFCIIFVGAIIYEIVRLIITIVSPQKTQEAYIEKKYIRTTTHYQNGMATGRSESPYIIFRMKDGTSREFGISHKDYRRFNTGDKGVLFYKGYHFITFHVLR